MIQSFIDALNAFKCCTAEPSGVVEPRQQSQKNAMQANPPKSILEAFNIPVAFY